MKRLLSMGPLVRLLPALLALGACKGDEGNSSITPAQSAVQFVHASHPQASSLVQFSDGTAPLAQLAYGQASSYLVLDAGSHDLKASGGGSTGTTTEVLVRDASYSYFAAPSVFAGIVSSQLVRDDLTLPANGGARIRLINLTANAGPDLTLAQATTAAGQTTYSPVAADTREFTDFTPATTSLVLLDATSKPLAQVGLGNGTGAGVRKYEAGHLYTAVAVGSPTAASTDAQLKVFVLVNR